MRLVYKLINFLSRLVLHPNPNGSRRIIDCFLAAPCQHLRRKLSQFGRIFIVQLDGVKGSADVKTCLTTWYSHEWTPLRVTLSNSLEWTIWMKYLKPRNHSCPNHLWMVVGVVTHLDILSTFRQNQVVCIGSWFHLKRLTKRFTKITQPHWNVIMIEL